MSASSSVDSLQKNAKADPYTVKASFDGKDLSTTEVTGDRTSGAFADAAKKQQMGKNDFLTLLTQQLKYQDPMQPMDNTQFVTQLAQFSQLENTTNQTKAMESLQKSFETSLAIQSNSAQSVTNSTSVSLIGKNVRMRQNTIDWNGKGSSNVRVNLGANKSAKVSIMNDKDEVVKEFKLSTKDATNASSFAWDGTNTNGQPVGAGLYKLKVEGQDKDPSLYCFVQDTVKGVRYTATGPVVNVAGKELPVGNILEVYPESSASNNELSELTVGQALGLVGKKVRYKDSGTTYAPKYNETKTLNVDLAGSSAATVVIKDGNGMVVQKYPISSGTGYSKLTIPLDDMSGSGGKYTVSLEDNDGAFFYKEGAVTGVTPSPSGVKIKVDGQEVSAKEILEVTA